MIPTEILKNEHKIILMVLDAAQRESTGIRDTGKTDAEKVNKMLDFFRNFADKCHHAKEENNLFVKMQEKGMSKDAGPIAVMLSEHNEGRGRLRAVSEALPKAAKGDALSIKTVKENLLSYVQLLRAHIEKEDNVLYPMADRMFSRNDQDELAEAFEKVEEEEIGKRVHDKYHRIAHELAGK